MERREGVPVGGFVFVSATGLLAAWWAYKRGLIGFRDFRVWLASHELVAQRCGLDAKRLPRFRIEELHKLVGGVGGEHLRASVRRLQAASLLTWSDTSIRHLVRLSALPEDSQAFVSRVTNHRRKIPVPRRLLRLLAAESRPVMVATAVGHLCRCMYYRNNRCSPSGLCKASWIADHLEVDERNVKAARKELEKRGVLIRDKASQKFLNWKGVPMRFNLHWKGISRRTETPPQAVVFGSETPPPIRTGISLSRSKNQKPAAVGPHGVRKRTGGGPRLSHIEVIDLQDPRRLVVLHAQAKRCGYVTNSEADRLKFFAAAEHARGKGTRNAPGLFATIVRRGLWEFVSQSEEDAARRRVRSVNWPGSDSESTDNHDPVSGSEQTGNEDQRAAIRELIRRSFADADERAALSA